VEGHDQGGVADEKDFEVTAGGGDHIVADYVGRMDIRGGKQEQEKGGKDGAHNDDPRILTFYDAVIVDKISGKVKSFFGNILKI
jgi:hypothetical protein